MGSVHRLDDYFGRTRIFSGDRVRYRGASRVKYGVTATVIAACVCETCNESLVQRFAIRFDDGRMIGHVPARLLEVAP